MFTTNTKYLLMATLGAGTLLLCIYVQPVGYPPTIEEHQLAVGIKKAFNGSVIVSCPVTDWKCQMSVEGSHSMTVHVVTMGIEEETQVTLDISRGSVAVSCPEVNWNCRVTAKLDSDPGQRPGGLITSEGLGTVILNMPSNATIMVAMWPKLKG